MTWITINVKPYDEELNKIERSIKERGKSMVVLHIIELKDGGMLVEYDVVDTNEIHSYNVPVSALVDRDAAMKFMLGDNPELSIIANRVGTKEAEKIHKEKLTTMEQAILSKQYDDFVYQRGDHKHDWKYTTVANCKECGSSYTVAKDVDKFNPV